MTTPARPLAVGCVSALLLLPGCFLRPPPEVEPPISDPVVRPWAESVTRLGVVPVVPPSEDIYVGDVFLYYDNPDRASTPRGSEPIGLDTRWETIPVLVDLEEEYEQRISWPPRSYTPGSNPDAESLFSPQTTIRRARAIAIGPLTKTTFTTGDLNRLVPLEAVDLVRGSSWSDNKVVSVRFGDAVTYSIAINDLARQLIDKQHDGTRVLKPEFRDSLQLMRPSGTLWLRVVGEVIYARTADLTVQSLGSYSEDKKIEADSIGEYVPGDEDAKLDPKYAAFARARQINDELGAGDVADGPVSSVRFVSVADDSLTIRQMFNYPIAIGARGITLEVDAGTGEVRSAWRMGQNTGPAPTAVEAPTQEPAGDPDPTDPTR